MEQSIRTLLIHFVIVAKPPPLQFDITTIKMVSNELWNTAWSLSTPLLYVRGPLMEMCNSMCHSTFRFDLIALFVHHMKIEEPNQKKSSFKIPENKIYLLQIVQKKKTLNLNLNTWKH